MAREASLGAMPAAMSPGAPPLQEALEGAGRIIDRQVQADRCYPDLAERLAVPAPGEQRPPPAWPAPALISTPGAGRGGDSWRS